MVNITVKGIPEDLHRRLQARAEAHGRSLNKEIIASLEGLVRPQRVDVADFLAKVDRTQQGIPFQVDVEAIQSAVEEGRE